MSERTNPLDYPFIFLASALLTSFLLPVVFVVCWHAALWLMPESPTAYRDGAYAMCEDFAPAGVPAEQVVAVCTELADNLVASRADK